MIENYYYGFEISISEKAYSAKPNREDYKGMKFHKVVVNPSKFMEYIRLGYSYCHVYKNNHRSNADFLYTYFVNIDVDDSKVSLADYLNKPYMKPTLAYTTFSNKKNGLYSYRLIYCFSEQIDAQIYEPLYRIICSYVGLEKTKDDCGRVLVQLMNGNSLPDMEYYLSNRVYDVSDFAQKSSLQLYCRERKKYNSKELNCKKESNSNNNSINNIINNTIITDLNRLELPVFLAKYVRLGIVEQTKLDYNEDGYCLIPDTFMKVFNRIVWTNKQARISKFKDGEGRRKRLFVDACIIRKIEPDITFEKLLYNLVYRRMRYYNNRDEVLTNKVLIEKAKYVLDLPLSDLDDLEPTKHGKFTTSKEYCIEHNLKRKSYARIIQKDLNYQSIGEWYDLNKTISENYEYAKQNDIKVCISTLRRFCKD